MEVCPPSVHRPLPTRLRQLIVPLLVIGFILVAQLFAPQLEYNRTAILNGEYWRLLTGHCVHTGWPHLLLNLTGVALLYALFATAGSVRTWLCWGAGTLACALLISLGLLWGYPEVTWYRGLSGLLHALLAMGLIVKLGHGQWLYALGLLALAVKLTLENLYGPSQVSSELISADVIQGAHLLGAMAGTVIAGMILALQRLLKQRHPNHQQPKKPNVLTPLWRAAGDREEW